MKTFKHLFVLFVIGFTSFMVAIIIKKESNKTFNRTFNAKIESFKIYLHHTPYGIKTDGEWRTNYTTYYTLFDGETAIETFRGEFECRETATNYARIWAIKHTNTTKKGQLLD